jgi:hypothetical protein
MSSQIIRPQQGPQETVLSSAADIAVFGGSAFGGKTWALLLEGIRHTGNPDFGAVFFRRTSPQITNEGGLWDEAGKLYPLAGAVPKVGDLSWSFPSGACISMRHLQHEKTKYDWQGTSIALLGFDELTHFSESQFFYLLSRNRSQCGVRPYVRCTTNPDSSSWVKRFLAPWIDRKYPDRAASGEIRWFIRVNGQIIWGRSADSFKDEHPGARPKSVTFIRSSIFDNKIGMDRDPDYLANLQAQNPVDRARLLDGDWDVANEGLVYPEFGTAVVEPEDWPASIAGERIGGIDWGWNNPFAALLGTLDHDDVLWLDWERYGSRITLTDHSKGMPRGDITWWADPAGADQINEMRAAGHQIRSATHKGQKPLEDGIAKVAARIRTGRLKVRGSLGNLIDEAGKYRYEKDGEKPLDQDNHALAALRYMTSGIDRRRSVDGKSKNTEDAEAMTATERADAAAQLLRELQEAEWEANKMDDPRIWEGGGW